MTTTNEDKKAPAAAKISSDFLIRGSEYVARQPGFTLQGRAEDLKNASTVLMRQTNNNLVLYGPSGVGLTSVIMGLQTSKEDLATPSDIVGKRFFWLDTDALFASGDNAKITEGFKKVLATLTRTPDTVLVMDDVKGFIEGVRNSGTTHLINMLMYELKNNKNLQAIFESRDGDLAEVFKMHPEVREIFTFQEVREPNKEDLMKILKVEVKSMEEFHGVSIPEEALKSVIDLTAKYPGLTLNTAQPKRSIVILEGALTALRYKAHTRPLGMDEMEQNLAIIKEIAEKGSTKAKLPAELEGKSNDELAAMGIEIEAKMKAVHDEWVAFETEIRKIYKDQRIGDEQLRTIEENIEKQKVKDEEAKKQKAEAEAKAGPQPEAQATAQQEAKKSVRGFGVKLNTAGFEGAEMAALMKERTEVEALVAENSKKFKDLTAERNANQNLVLGGDHILIEFSRLSGIPMNKLQQDETQKLLNMEKILKERVFGQDDPVAAVAKAVRRGRTGLKKPNKPIGSFIFLGPSGVGKTELAKALAATLFGDESALVPYDMSEFQGTTAASKLIGADPGLVGFEDGGRLTNAMRKRPYCVNVFDEIEKAHRDVFDVFLQIVDEGRLTDNRGIPAYFGNAINIMTSNVGAKHFLDETISFDEAKKKAMEDLYNPEVGGFRPEFLNRFTGIFCFNRLGQLQIEMICDKSLKELNGWIKDQGLFASISQEDKTAMCKDKYIPKMGARGILNYIENTVTSDIAETLLRHPDMKGKLQITYDPKTQEVKTTFIPSAENAANTNEPAKEAAPAKAAQAFKAAVPGKGA